MSLAGIKVQLVRFCVQCEDILPRRCTKCIIHPSRKPRVVELFGVPPVLSTNTCGCVKIVCQRGGCGRTMWRHPSADGTLGRKNHFCSPECVRIVTAAAKRAARVSSLCSCGCRRLVVRAASNMRAKQVYFGQKCHFLHRIALKAEARRAEANGDDSIQAFCCESPRCRGAVTDHAKLTGGLYDCVRCHKRSPLPGANVEAYR